jgi:epoxyqueuosine reductase QueG
MQNIESIITNFLSENVSIWGIADLENTPAHPYPELKRAIVFGIALDREIIKNLDSGPYQAYIDECNIANEKLTSIGMELEKKLQQMGHRAISMTASKADIDENKLEAEFPHKTTATKAGLGWVGKCDLLVTKEFGSALRLNTIFTDTPLKAGKPMEKSLCGTCSNCIDKCPVNAPTGKQWAPSVHRDKIIDIQQCYRECQRASRKINFDHPLCGRCIIACPWTQKYVCEV